MEEHTADDQSHYEISLTAGQAFVAFVLLLLSLAATFAFGLMLGKGQADDRLVVQKETPVVTEASLAPKKPAGDIVELGVQNDDFTGSDEDEDALAATEPAAEPAAAPVTDTAAAAVATPQIVEAAPEAEDAADAPKPAAETAAAPQATPRVTTPAPAPVVAAKTPAATKPAATSKAHLAQLLSTGDQKAAEALAVKLIDGGFSSAYVERGSTENGPIYRVRVKFNSEQDARGAEPKLRAFSKDVWITAR
ncbi:MAG TPA: SPOR domain-containing protein [Thermoanaerobaculia bacterium]|nr:SPOR domain-containing protein [Thermoanaerobaculia bacterium]